METTINGEKSKVSKLNISRLVVTQYDKKFVFSIFILDGLEIAKAPFHATVPLKIHKNENFFGFDSEFCTISLLVMHK